jgi:hypothetical protein
MGGRDSVKFFDDDGLQYRSLRYPIGGSTTSPHIACSGSRVRGVITDQFFVGPVNDVIFLDLMNPLETHRCGPFDTEREFMEATAFRGRPPTRHGGPSGEAWSMSKSLEVYDVVKSFYQRSSLTVGTSSSSDENFHFCHGDLSVYNILVDPTTGAVTGVIDWEMSGFRPAWLMATAPEWFNDDVDRFLMSSFQESPRNYANETPADALVRAHFRRTLASLDQDFFRHYLQGMELRAFFHSCCNVYESNTMVWLGKYMKQEWPARRGPFPFDYWTWIEEKLLLEEASHVLVERIQ